MQKSYRIGRISITVYSARNDSVLTVSFRLAVKREEPGYELNVLDGN